MMAANPFQKFAERALAARARVEPNSVLRAKAVAASRYDTWCVSGEHLPLDMLRVDPKAIDETKRGPHVHPVIWDQLSRWAPRDGSMLITAPTGSGKTMGVVHRLEQLWKAIRASDVDSERADWLACFRYLDCRSFAADERETRLGTGAPQAYVRALGARVLVLDELGHQRGDSDMVARLVNERYQGRRRPTIALSGHTLEKLTELVGEALIRRLTWTGYGRHIGL